MIFIIILFYKILSIETCRSSDNEECYKTQHLRKQTCYILSTRTKKNGAYYSINTKTKFLNNLNSDLQQI
jgi:hypothetical protein